MHISQYITDEEFFAQLLSDKLSEDRACVDKLLEHGFVEVEMEVSRGLMCRVLKSFSKYKTGDKLLYEIDEWIY